MRKPLMLLLALSLVTSVSGCGGGSSSGSAGASTVNIRIGEDGKTACVSIEKYPLLSGLGGYMRRMLSPGEATAAIPSDITHIVFTISAPDMTTITRDVPVAGKSFISESFTIPNGGNRRFLVEAMNQRTVQYRKEASANLDGRPLTIVLDMEDVAPPSFAGLVSAKAASTTSIELSWAPGTDNVTPSSQLTYLIYMSTTPGGENFSSPAFTTERGAVSYTVTGLKPDTTYYFVVRCSDVEGGNQETNAVEKSATTARAPNTSPPTFGGLASATVPAGAEDRIDLSWSPASDNRTAASSMVYLIYMTTSPGGENFASPGFTTQTGATSFSVTGLSPGTTYYFVVRARDEAGNTDSNRIEKSATTPRESDTTPPSFGGITSAIATAGGTGQADLSWSPASDNRTAANSMVYLIYMATSPGGENFTSPSFTTQAGATSFSVTGLSPGTTCYFVVRARDEAGNIDSNRVERLVTIPDSMPPSFAGLISAIRSPLAGDRVNLSWNQASDNVTPSANIVYLVYHATSPGGENYASPSFTTTPGATSFTVSNLSAGMHYFVVRARDAAGNVDPNTVEIGVYL